MKILLTGHGELACALQKKYSVSVCSFRGMSDEEIIHAIEHSDCIVHNAALLNNTSLELNMSANFDLSVKIVELCKKYKPCVRLIYIGSMSVVCDDGSYQSPALMSPYALSKYFAELYCLKSGLSNLSIVRFSTIFYKNPARDGLSSMIQEAVSKNTITLLNGGRAKRDFIPIDVGAGYLYKIALSSATREAITIAGGKEWSFIELAGVIQRYLPGIAINDIPGPLESKSVTSLFSTQALRKFGIIKYSLEQEIEDYVAELKQNANGRL